MITIIAFIILLGVLVVIHEGGHFFVLRMCKVHVDRFSVGMGPVIYKKKDKKEKKNNYFEPVDYRLERLSLV